jgi:hypothetical protein
MAKVWFVSAHDSSIDAPAAAEMPVWKCVHRLKLRRGMRAQHFDLSSPGVEVEITEADAKKAPGWEVGRYRLPMSPQEVRAVLLDS